jgi:hypothetical protein
MVRVHVVIGTAHRGKRSLAGLWSSTRAGRREQSASAARAKAEGDHFQKGVEIKAHSAILR